MATARSAVGTVRFGNTKRLWQHQWLRLSELPYRSPLARGQRPVVVKIHPLTGGE